MLRKTYTYIALCLIIIIQFLTSSLISQNNLTAFDNLVNKTWKADGQWSDGSHFMQEITFYNKLNNNLIISETIGYTDGERTELGERNFGIRKWDTELQKIVFTEHDIFGCTTQGRVTTNKEGDIIYTYKYGESQLTDYWKKISNSKYKLTIGIYKEDSFQKIFLETYMQSDN